MFPLISFEGPEKEKFTDTAFLVLVNRCISILFSVLMIISNHERLSPSAPLPAYSAIALGNFLATFCQYEALKYVSFPTQTLGKCAKMIPVLIIGTLFKRKTYSWKEYAIAMLLTAGCTIYLTTGVSFVDFFIKFNFIFQQISGRGASSDSPFGLFLIACYLAFDGFTSTTQESLFKSFNMSTNNQMLYVNITSAFLSILVLVVPIYHVNSDGISFNSRLSPAFSFAFRHPELLADSILLSLCSSLGQMVIYYTIKEFGALLYSTIMTTRQFLGLFLSALVFAHPISTKQWIGSFLVFVALYWKALFKSNPKKTARKDIEAGIVTSGSNKY